MTQESSKAVSKHAWHFFSGTLISRLSGGVRDVAMAICFGAHPAIAALLVAFRFSNIFRRLFGEATTTTVFAPHFETSRKETERQGALFFRDLFVSIALTLLLIVLLGEVALTYLMHLPTFSPEALEILHLTRWMFPGLFFICLYGASGALLQCERRFFLPAIAPVAFNLLWIGGIALLWKEEGSAAAQGLALAITLAFCAQWALTAPASYHYLRAHLTLREIVTPRPFSLPIRRIVRPFLFAIIGVSAVQINTAADALFARYASLEGPAHLWYAIRLQQVPLSLFGLAIAGALLPPLSRAMEAGDLDTYRSLVRFALRRGFALVFPCAVALIALGPSGINLLYGHGHFTQEATYHTILSLWGYALGLIPMIFVLILAPAFYAKKEVLIPMRASLLSVACNILLNALFICVLGWGAYSVAIATSLSAFLNLYLLHSALVQKVSPLFGRETLLQFRKVAACTLIAATTTILLGSFLAGDSTLSILLGKYTLNFPRELPKQLLLFTTLFFSYSLLFLICARIQNVQEILELLPIRRKLR